MMGGVSPETCWAIKKHRNNKFYYTVESCWFLLWDLYYDARIHEHQVPKWQIIHLHVTFDVTPTMKAHIMDLWNMKHHIWLGTDVCLRDAHSISLQVWSKPRWKSGWLYVKIFTHLIFVLSNHFLKICYFCALKIEATCFSQTLVQPTRLHGAINQVAIIWTLLIYRADNSVTEIMES